MLLYTYRELVVHRTLVLEFSRNLYIESVYTLTGSTDQLIRNSYLYFRTTRANWMGSHNLEVKVGLPLLLPLDTSLLFQLCGGGTSTMRQNMHHLKRKL